MKPLIISLVLLVYAFVDWPIEIIDNFLSYLIPFIVAIFGLCFCIFNFYLIKLLNEYKKIANVVNIITTVIFSFLIIYNFPIPENTGFRCKNWTDISMLINPKNNSEQYISQSMEISGSIYSHRIIKSSPINSWLRWKKNIEDNPKTGEWLYIDNSKNGRNAVPFPLDNSKLNFEKDKSKAVIVNLGNNLK